ncbi:MAG: hypothetical protein AAGA21_04135 [Pseudomonadota bacterium]
MAKRTLGRALPLALAALLMLGGCDDEPEKTKRVLEVEVEKDTEVRVKIKDDKKSEMIVVGELALFGVFVVWALFGPGATRRQAAVSENG